MSVDVGDEGHCTLQHSEKESRFTDEKILGEEGSHVLDGGEGCQQRWYMNGVAGAGFLKEPPGPRSQGQYDDESRHKVIGSHRFRLLPKQQAAGKQGRDTGTNY